MTYLNRRFVGYGLLVVSLSTTFYLLRATKEPDRKSREIGHIFGREAGKMNSIVRSFGEYAAANPNEFQRWARGGIMTSSTSESRLAGLIEQDSPEGTNPLVDSYGNPFNIAISPTAGLTNSFVIVVWGNGANGRNDGGEGDDHKCGPYTINIASQLRDWMMWK